MVKEGGFIRGFRWELAKEIVIVSSPGLEEKKEGFEQYNIWELKVPSESTGKKNRPLCQT